MVAAFERARAERLAVQLPVDGADSAGDPWTRSNTAAFLVLERERRVVAARLSRHYRRRRDRYRDLILVTKLIHVEYEHLAGRAVEGADSPSPSNGDTGGGDRPADWARPWGSGPLIEMGTALSFYQDQRDQLGKRLPTLSRGSAAAAAAGHRDRVLSRFETVRGGRLGQEPLSAPPSERRAWPWKSPRFTRSAVAVACACVGDRRLGRSWARAVGPPASAASRRPSSRACPTPCWSGTSSRRQATARRLPSPTKATEAPTKSR